MGEGIRRAFSTQPSPQPAYRREEMSDLRIHGEKMVRGAFIIRMRVGDQKVERVIREGEYLVGSSPEADIRIVDPGRYISRRHAKLIV
jgi:pSer/pThr/pTyr-binding forkhead associated (FHA) protein